MNWARSDPGQDSVHFDKSLAIHVHVDTRKPILLSVGNVLEFGLKFLEFEEETIRLVR